MTPDDFFTFKTIGRRHLLDTPVVIWALLVCLMAFVQMGLQFAGKPGLRELITARPEQGSLRPVVRIDLSK